MCYGSRNLDITRVPFKTRMKFVHVIFWKDIENASRLGDHVKLTIMEMEPRQRLTAAPCWTCWVGGCCWGLLGAWVGTLCNLKMWVWKPLVSLAWARASPGLACTRPRRSETPLLRSCEDGESNSQFTNDKVKNRESHPGMWSPGDRFFLVLVSFHGVSFLYAVSFHHAQVGKNILYICRICSNDYPIAK